MPESYVVIYIDGEGTIITECPSVLEVTDACVAAHKYGQRQAVPYTIITSARSGVIFR